MRISEWSSDVCSSDLTRVTSTASSRRSAPRCAATDAGTWRPRLPKRFTFRTDAAATIGFGHLRRCLALAEAVAVRGHDTCFLLSDLSEKAACDLVSGAGFSILRIDGAGRLPEEIEALEAAAQTSDVVIADLAHAHALAQRDHLSSYFRRLRRQARHLVVIAGLGRESLADDSDGIAALPAPPYSCPPAGAAGCLGRARVLMPLRIPSTSSAPTRPMHTSSANGITFPRSSGGCVAKHATLSSSRAWAASPWPTTVTASPICSSLPTPAPRRALPRPAGPGILPAPPTPSSTADMLRSTTARRRPKGARSW